MGVMRRIYGRWIKSKGVESCDLVTLVEWGVVRENRFKFQKVKGNE